MLQEDSIAAVETDSFSVLDRQPSTLDKRDFAHEGYFAGSPYFHPEMGVSRSGVVGDPVPYSFASDNSMVAMLLAVFLLLLLSVVRSWSFIVRQVRLFFHAPRRVAEASDDVSAIRHQKILFFLCPISVGAAYFMFRYVCLGNRFLLEPNVAVVGVFSVVVLVALSLRSLLYSLVNWVFFDKAQREQWSYTMLFFTTTFGILMFPVTLVVSFFSITQQFVLIYIISVVIFVELLLFFRCFVIFFKGSSFPLQIILYFCTLELIPIAFLWVMWDLTAGYLATNI